MDSEGVCDPIDVVEVAAHLHGIVDRTIVPFGGAQGSDVVCAAPGRVGGQPLGEVEKRRCRRINPGRAPIDGESIHEVLIGDLRPEIVEMCPDSVDALVHL